MSKIQTRIRAIQASKTMSEQEKTQQLRTLYVRANNIARQALREQSPTGQQLYGSQR